MWRVVVVVAVVQGLLPSLCLVGCAVSAVLVQLEAMAWLSALALLLAVVSAAATPVFVVVVGLFA